MAIKEGKVFSYGSNGEIHPYEYFSRRCEEERQRTDRSGKPFSVLIIDFHHLLNGNGTWKFLNGKLTKEICNAVLESTRLTDLKGWYESNRLAVLLPDTNTKGVKFLVKKLQEKLNKNMEKFLKFEDLIKDKIILTSSTYPDHIMERESNENKSIGSSRFSEEGEAGVAEYLDRKTYYKNNGNGSWKHRIGLLSLRPSHEIIALNPVLLPFIISSDLKASLSKGIKRIMDIIGALLAILMSSPIMLVCALLIKITSSGPVLFRQERIGYLGRRFTFLKFRSMYKDIDHKIHETYVTNFIEDKLDCDSQQAEVYKLKDDSRITLFGRFLRKTSLDEFPQFFNVLKGDMSLVGPRPPIPYEVDKYKLWHRKRILGVKPGITGLWQVRGRSTTTFEDMVRLDLQYANNWSLKMDIMLLLKTVKAVLLMRGAC